jgi:hypothetical protein
VGLVEVGLADVDFGGGGAEELLVVGAAEEASTVPGVYPGNRLILCPAAPGRATWFPMGLPAEKATISGLGLSGQ